MSAPPEITVTFRRETDGRWIAFVKRFKLSIIRNDLDTVRRGFWEWLVERLNAGGIEGIDPELAEELRSLNLQGRVDDPWAGRVIGDSQKYLPVLSVVDALQWTGGNLPEVIRYISHTNGFIVIPASQRYLILESEAGRSGMDSGDWLIRDSDNNLSIMRDVQFRKMFVPLPVPKGQEVPVLDEVPGMRIATREDVDEFKRRLEEHTAGQKGGD